jgi:hypothetical protein
MFSLSLASGSTSEVSNLDLYITFNQLEQDQQGIYLAYSSVMIFNQLKPGSTCEVPNLFLYHDLQPIGTRINR